MACPCARVGPLGCDDSNRIRRHFSFNQEHDLRSYLGEASNHHLLRCVRFLRRLHGKRSICPGWPCCRGRRPIVAPPIPWRPLPASLARNSSALQLMLRFDLTGLSLSSTSARLPRGGAKCGQGIRSFAKRKSHWITHRCREGVRRLSIHHGPREIKTLSVAVSSLVTYGQKTPEAGDKRRPPRGRENLSRIPPDRRAHDSR
ncbi:hypothetical protein TBK1r_10960 [Stieleria magnilauensis]|uniref:Uncharacterized protein n=1 Tax=Stieleria magnilauensis TaxID=2527963 RepID=A0ABX5XNH2_9BACT|nr:hypothetical protein TBK1r_10960 [Planctomycetes bacterium TBK1r]